MICVRHDRLDFATGEFIACLILLGIAAWFAIDWIDANITLQKLYGFAASTWVRA